MFADAIGAGISEPASVQQAAAHGVSGSGGSLPHLGAIQRAFGRHDVSSVQAHVGGKAAEGSAAMGARAYATGGQVAFAESPDLHLAAHEAAHVVQQRGGVQLSGGVGAVGDVYEQHADAVADCVTRGESAEALLDQHAPSGGAGTGVQRAVQMDGPGDAIRGPRGRHVGPHAAPPAARGAFDGSVSVREHAFFEGRCPVGPYVYFTEGKIRGNVQYQIEHAAPEAPEGEHADEPTTTVHGGVGGLAGHGSHHGHVGLEAAVEHRFCELWSGAELAGSAGGEVTQHEANVNVGLSLGHLTLGGISFPLPSASLHVVDLTPEHGIRLLVAEVVVPFGVQIPLTIGDERVIITPSIQLVLEFEPNWVAIAPHLGGAAAEVAADGAAAVEAAEAAGAGAETVAAVGAEAELMTAGAVGLEALAAPAAVILAPIAIGAFMFGMFQHDIAAHEEIWARSTANCRTLFMYCMAYTSAWCGTGDMAGRGATEGARDAHADMDRVLAQHPGADMATLARRWGPVQIYNSVYDIAAPLATEWLISRTEARGNDAEVIHSQIRQTRWGGSLWGRFCGDSAEH